MTQGQRYEVGRLIAADPGAFVGLIAELLFGSTWRRVYKSARVW